MFTPQMLLKHSVALILIAICLALAVWQGQRALNGNALSWAYTVEWPVFAGFVVVVWLREIRSAREKHTPTSQPTAEPEDTPSPVPPPPRPSTAHDDEDPELAAYNNALRTLAERNHQ